MWGTWSTHGIKEGWRPSYLPFLLRNNSGLKQDGNTFITRQANKHTGRTDQLVRHKKAHKMANTLIGWLSTPRHQSCLPLQNINFVSRMYATTAKVKEPNILCLSLWHAHFIHPHCSYHQCISWSSIMIPQAPYFPLTNRLPDTQHHYPGTPMQPTKPQPT